MEDTRIRLEARLDEIQAILDEGEQIKALLRTMDEVSAGPVAHGETEERMSVEARNLQILEYLRDNEGVRNRDLAEALQLTSGRIAQLLKDLLADGLVERTDGTLSLTGAGMASMFDVSFEVVSVDE